MTFFIPCLLPAFSTFTPSSFAMTRSEKSSKLGDQGMVADSYVEEHRGCQDGYPPIKRKERLRPVRGVYSSGEEDCF
ncbi:hypothetical protein Q3G72_012633 [Acer saccharum]|nr:hypothetical protein Q3G72_012633 [Acer saccharum]